MHRNFSVKLDWAYAERHSIEFSYWSLDRSSSRSIRRDMEIGGVVFPIGAEARVEFDTTTLGAAYTYWFMRHENFGLGGTIGLVYFGLDARASASVEVGGAGGSASISEPIREIVLALPTDVEGDATSSYLARRLAGRDVKSDGSRVAVGGNRGIGMTSQRTRLRMVERLRARGIRDEAVLAVMGELPRHIFVVEALASRAYEDNSLPLGFGQTISSPHTVARMTELARKGRTLGKVLEIGTGCGYQTAVLARLAKQVYSVERIAALIRRARKHLREGQASC